MVGFPLSQDHVVRSWHEWEMDGSERYRILVIETDIVMQPEEPGYQAGQFEGLWADAVARLRASASAIDRIRIVPVRY